MMLLLQFLIVLIAAQNCTVKILGDKAKGYDGYCWELANDAGIDVATLERLNNFICNNQVAGTRCCITPGTLPPPPVPPSPNGQYCVVKKLGDPADGFDGYCADLASNNRISLEVLNFLNGFNCIKEGQRGQRLCVTAGALPPIPDPIAGPDGKCKVIEVDPVKFNTCGAIWTEGKITEEQLHKFNKGRNYNCQLLKPGFRFCVTLGDYPSRAPVQPNPNAPCIFVQANAEAFFNCDNVAAAYDLTVEQVTQWNANSWQFEGCTKSFGGHQKICISQGIPPPPVKLDPSLVQCGAQAPDSQRECPLKACCSKWGIGFTKIGWCGTTEGFCTKVEGAPGLGCQSNCDMGVPAAMKVCDGQWKRIGYYESWNVGRPDGCPTVEPNEIDASKWTHIHYGFAVVTESGELDMANQGEREQLMKLQDLKIRYPDLKLIISVGGWAFNNRPTNHLFTNLAASPQKRANFVQSVVRFLNLYKLDGFDIDWEYPTAPERGGRPEDGTNYVALVRDLRAGLGRFSLSIAAPASYWYLKGFEIAEMAKYLDYIVYMTYDLHGNWDWANKWVGPTLNPHNNWTEVEGALTMIQRAGVPSNKILLGIGYYGRSFLLSTPFCDTPGVCTFQDPGPLREDIDNYSNLATPGKCTQAGGTLASFEIQDIIKQQKLTPKYDEKAIAKLLTYNNGKEWVGYDDDETIAIKAAKAREMCLGGLVVWALDLDDDLLTNTLSDGGFLGESSTYEFVPWSPLKNEFFSRMTFSLDNGIISDSMLDKIDETIATMFRTFTMTQYDATRLVSVGVSELLKRSRNWISDRVQLQSTDNLFKIKNDDLLQFQTQGPGRNYYQCVENSKEITCPIPSGSWRNGHLITDPTDDIEWRLKDAGGLRKALEATFGLNWDLTKVQDVFVSYSERECDSIDGWRKCQMVFKGAKYTGLRVYEESLKVNHFSGHAIELYDNAIKADAKDRVASFMNANRDLFHCESGSGRAISCLSFKDSTVKWIPNSSPGEVLKIASEKLGIEAEYLEFGSMAFNMPQTGFCPDDNSLCRDFEVEWQGVVQLKSNYPPPMKDLINNHLKSLQSSIDSAQKSIDQELQSEEEINSDLATLIFLIGSSNDMIEQITQYEAIVSTELQREQDQRKEMAEMIVSMIVTEVIVSVVTAGIGSVIIPAVINGYRAAKYSATVLKISSMVDNLPSLKTWSNGLSGVKSYRKIAEMFSGVFKTSSKFTKRAGEKLKKTSDKLKNIGKCYCDTAIELGVDQVVGVASPFRREFAIANDTLLYKRANNFDPCPFTKDGAKKLRADSEKYRKSCLERGDYFKLDGKIDKLDKNTMANIECDHIVEISDIYSAIFGTKFEEIYSKLSTPEAASKFCANWQRRFNDIKDYTNSPNNVVFLDDTIHKVKNQLYSYDPRLNAKGFPAKEQIGITPEVQTVWGGTQNGRTFPTDGSFAVMEKYHNEYELKAKESFFKRKHLN
jgi:GH18 family chitinase